MFRHWLLLVGPDYLGLDIPRIATQFGSAIA